METETAKVKKWTWVDGTGKPGTIMFGDPGPVTSFKLFMVAELSQWLYAVETANEVFCVLTSAKERFENGTAANYEDACSRLHRLLGEIEKAGHVLLIATREVGRFFEDVPGLKESIAALSPEELDQFVREAIPLLQAQVAKKESEAK